MFEGLNADRLARLSTGTREIWATRGDVLFRKDEPCNGLYLVVYGRVKLVFLSSQGSEKTLEILEPGSTFCESTLFLKKTYPAFAQTLTDCLLLHIGKEVILSELERESPLALRIINSLARQLSERTSDIESYSLYTGRQRIVAYLLRELSEGNATFDKGGNSPCITLMTAKGVIASRLNLTQEHFSRVLHELAQAGLLTVEGRNIHIRNLEQFRLAA